MDPNNTQQRYEYLASKWKSKLITAEEELELVNWLNKDEDTEVFIPSSFADSESSLRKNLFEVINKDIQITSQTQVKTLRKWSRYATAAVLLVSLSFGLYFYLSNAPTRDDLSTTESIKYANDIAPGGNRATLTLADGSIVDLSDTQDGIIVNSENIKYNDGSSITPNVISTEAERTVRLPGNTPERQLVLSTPKGGQYKVTLSDGTKVWLNSGSSIHYPAQFTGVERLVELTGEAYFEVAKNKALPFRVKSNNQIVEVLGTHFNIISYSNESTIRTTVLEGSVKVSSKLSDKRAESVILIPGQQSLVTLASLSKKEDVDLDEVIAWKKGDFKFSGNLEEILEKVARWYDVEIVYQDKFNGSIGFVGKISMSKNLSDILNYMESAGNVHFKVEGRRVIVMK